MTRAGGSTVRRGILGVLLLACSGASALAQTAAMTRGTGTAQLVIDGGPFHGETIALLQKSGDWFGTPTDAHAALTLSGTAQGNPVVLDLQWDGLQKSQVINAENNTDLGGAHVSFFLTMNGKAPYDLMAKPHGEDAVTITVTKIDELAVQATIAGAVTSSAYDEAEHRFPVLTIKGTIDLHRAAAPVRPISGSYSNCDNVIRDKMAGAEARSPSECEVKFDLDVRQALQRALQKVRGQFSQAPWQIERETAVKAITGVARSSEKNFFRMEFSSGDHYSLDARMDPGSDPYQAYRARFDELSAKVGEEARASGGKLGPAYDAMKKLGDEINGATKVGIVVNLNESSGGFVNFTGEHRVLEVPGAAYAVATSRVQAPTGGGIDQSLANVTYVFLGRWKPGTFETLGDGGEQFRIASTMTPTASHLSVQNITLRIECNPALTDAVLKQIDFAGLQALIAR